MTNEKILRVGCYIRVSTQEQAKEGYSIGAQTERLKSYCVARGWLAHEMYIDPGYSGAKLERPALKKLVSDALKHKIDLVLVYKLDRLSRSQKDTLYLIEDVFIKNDVAFVSINENFDTSTAFGRAMIGILSVFAQLEREQIKERTQMGRTERAKSGLWHGGGYFPIGYDYNIEENELTINEYEAMQVREVFDLFVNKHYSFHRIQQCMTGKGYKHKHGCWNNASTIKNVLSNNIYVSLITWEGIDYQGQHKAILADDIFKSAQVRLEETGWKRGEIPKKSPFDATQMLSGVIFCQNCGGRYYGSGAYRGSHKLPNSQKDYIHIYTCYSRTKTKKEMIKDPACKNKNWKAPDLDRYIINEILKLNFECNFNSLVEKAHSAAAEPSIDLIIENQIKVLDTQITKMLDLLQFGNTPTDRIAQRLEKITKEKSSLENQLEAIDSEPTTLPLEVAREALKNACSTFESGTLTEKRDLIQTLINRIDILENEVTITWSFI